MTVYKLSQHSKDSKMGKPGHVQLMGGRGGGTAALVKDTFAHNPLNGH